jgi:hypothetical protein
MAPDEQNHVELIIPHHISERWFMQEGNSKWKLYHKLFDCSECNTDIQVLWDLTFS